MMGFRRTTTTLGISTALIMLLAGCSSGGAPPGSVASASAGTSEALGASPVPSQSSTGYPVTVENCGRSLTFDEAPSRVVTGYQPVLETLLALGLEDRIIGRLNFSENGPDGFLPGQKALYEAIPEINDTIVLPSKEIMLTQDADFVIDVSAISSFDPANGQATIEELDDAGAQVFITGGWCDAQGVRAFKIEDTIDDVRELGMIFGVTDRAEQLATEFEATLAGVRERVSGEEPVRVLAIDGGDGPVNAYGGSGLTDQMIDAAGGVNVLAGIDEDYTEVSVESIAAADPEAVLVSDYVVYFGEAFPSAEEKAEAVFPLIPESAAAQERRFQALPVAGQHPGYRNILTVELVARFLHPDAFD